MHSFDIHAPRGANKPKRIVGRGQGSGRGTTAGKGNKGQQSRSGGKTYLGFEGGQMPLFRKLAKRGFSNYPFKVENQPVSLAALDKHYADGETVDALTLAEKGIAGKGSVVKILSGGDLTKKLTIKRLKISKAARGKVLKKGGEVEDIPPKAKPVKGKKKEKKAEING